ncbi:MarR family transcriptional regulator [Paenibacillus larvae]
MKKEPYESDMHSSLGYNLHRIGQLVREETSIPLKQYGITPEQWQILIALYERDSITPTELGEATLRDKTTISRILPALLQKGIIEKKANPNDGRSYMIKLCEHYREMIVKSLVDVKVHFEEKVFPIILTEQEQSILLEIILKLRRGLKDN